MRGSRTRSPIKPGITICWLIFIFLPITASALTFSAPVPDNNIVGTIQTAIAKPDDTYASIAERYDVGYYSLFESNPGVNPDNPPVGTVLVIPTQYILPKELRPNTIVINLAELRLYYQSSNDDQVYIFPLGIGREGWTTPTGKFKIMQKIEHPHWLVPKSIRAYRAEHGDPVPKVVPPGPDNPLGDYALRLSNPKYLIHGTNDPVGIGRRSSAGCIRLYPQDIQQLFSMVNKKTKVVIINDPYKIGSDNQQLYVEAHMPLNEQRTAMHGDLSIALNNIRKDLAKTSHDDVNWNKILTIVDEHIGIPQNAM